MASNQTLPAIDDCIDLYIQIHDDFGTEAFAPEEVAARVDDLSADEHSLVRLLNLLVAYGLLDRNDDGQYRVRCAPNESLDRWRAAATSRVEFLHRLVQRTTIPESATDDAGGDSLRYEGDAFASVYVDDAGDLDSAETAIENALAEQPECVGIVLRSPGDVAAEVQRFADRLRENNITTADRSFEKEMTDLVGDDKDNLEFRLFLRETR